MNAQSTEATDQHDVIHLGGEAAVVVPMDEYRRLRALELRASAEDLEAAEADAVLQTHREWVAAGRPGPVSHEERWPSCSTATGEDRVAAEGQGFCPPLYGRPGRRARDRRGDQTFTGSGNQA